MSDGWMDGQMNEPAVRWMDSCLNGWTDSQMDSWIDG